MWVLEAGKKKRKQNEVIGEFHRYVMWPTLTEINLPELARALGYPIRYTTGKSVGYSAFIFFVLELKAKALYNLNLK